ncbi:MAG TPA: M20 aminoacylase family protein [Variovorax sp.]
MRDWMARHQAEFAQLRQQIHQHPELSFEEFQTSDLVAQCLQSWGWHLERGIGGTGLVAQLKRGQGARRLGIRAEMDALALTEMTELPYASRCAGVMHACGHDGHTTMLLFAAKYIAEHRRFDGTLNLIFQPAEEGGNGASRMMEDGLFERYPCDAVFGMHNMPGVPAGRLAFRSGAAMASGDEVTIRLTGRGGHGALPHLAADPTVAAASIVMALQTVVSRNVDPLHAAVVTVGVLHAGTACNVIPETALLKLTVRALDRAARDTVEQRIRSLVQAQAESFDVSAEVNFARGYPVLVNTLEETEFARSVARSLVGPGGMDEHGPAYMAAEDFAFMLERVPGCYLFIGNGTHIKEGGCSVHNPHYDFNDRILPVGAAYWAALVEQFLPVATS